MKRIVAVLFCVLVGCEDVSEMEMLEEAPVDGGQPPSTADAGVLADAWPSADAAADAAAPPDASTPADADAAADTGVLPLPDASAVADASSSPPDASASADASQPALSYDASVLFLRRECSTSADCMDPFYVTENSAPVLISLPRPGHDSPAEQPVCALKNGGTVKRCSFFCQKGDPTGATLGTSVPDHKRWCDSFGAQCLPAGIDSVCAYGALP